MKLEYNNLPHILEFIRNPQNKDAILLIESCIYETKKNQFKVGSKVIFGRKKGEKHEGVIEKINSSKAIISSNNRQWNVPFELMERI
jgi:uncharacterized protein Veg